jgi:hypothetical protein
VPACRSRPQAFVVRPARLAATERGCGWYVVGPPQRSQEEITTALLMPSENGGAMRRRLAVGVAVVNLVLACSCSADTDSASGTAITEPSAVSSMSDRTADDSDSNGARPTAGSITAAPTTTVAPHGTLPPSSSATALPKNGSLAPGTYAVAKPGAASDYSRLSVTLPAGWSISDGLVHKRLDQVDEMAFSVWTGVYDVYDDPCHWQESSVSNLDLGDEQVHSNFHEATTGATVRKPLHGGLANQIGRNASELTSVELGGQSALKIELSVPAELDLATCDQGQFRSWTGSSVTGDANAHHSPGQIDVVYMVDVDRSALVIDASHMPATSASDLAELEAIFASMIIER